MKTLNQITQAARIGHPLTEEELRLAVCAYDVMIAQLNPNDHLEVLAEYFKAAEASPKEYIGWGNHPDNPDFVKWYAQNVTPNFNQIAKRATEIVNNEHIK